MAVTIHWDVSDASRARLSSFTDALAERAVLAGLAEGEREGLEVAVIFVSDSALTELHGRFLGDDSPTDVITFDLGEEGEDDPSAELYVSVDAAFRCAAEHGLAVDNELLLYVAHGTLHLCGFDDHDQEERKVMRLAEVRVLASLGVELDIARHEQA